MDYQPKALSLTWEQRISQLSGGQQPTQIEQGDDVINAEFTEAASESKTKHKEGELLEESKQTGQQAQEEAGD